MKTYMIQSAETGEIYVSDGVYANGPIDYTLIDIPLTDFNLDDAAPDWVANKDGIILRGGQ